MKWWHYKPVDGIVEVKLYGVPKIIGKAYKSAWRDDKLTWYWVKPLYFLGTPLKRIGDYNNGRWFRENVVSFLCHPPIKNCDCCKYKFLCWTIRS